MSWVEFITIIIAMIGAILGIYNTAVGYLRRKVQLKLQIGPASSFFDMALKENEVWGLRVTNLSEFPVTLTDINGRLFDQKNYLSLEYYIPHDSSFPKTLESRRSVTICIYSDQNFPAYDSLKKVKVFTDCGRKKSITLKKD